MRLESLGVGDPLRVGRPYAADDAERAAAVKAARARGEPTVPSRLSDELATNPFLRAARPEVKIISTEPAGAALLEGKPWQPHKIQGWTPDFIPAVLDQDVASSPRSAATVSGAGSQSGAPVGRYCTPRVSTVSDSETIRSNSCRSIESPSIPTRITVPPSAACSTPGSDACTGDSWFALQSTVKQGRPARSERACTARAMSSLPVPGSPRTSSGADEEAIRDIFVGTHGAELSRLKNAVDSDAETPDLHQLLFGDLRHPQIRMQILEQYMACFKSQTYFDTSAEQ